MDLEMGEATPHFEAVEREVAELLHVRRKLR